MIELKDKRIVMTGATGFIGSHVAGILLSQGASVYAIVRRESRQKDRLPFHPNLHLVSGSMADVLSCIHEIGSADAFLHFAWGGVNRCLLYTSRCV